MDVAFSPPDPYKKNSYTVGSAKVSRPTSTNSRRGPVPARSVQVNAPVVSTSQDDQNDEGKTGWLVGNVHKPNAP